jgi:hypothetical protein
MILILHHKILTSIKASGLSSGTTLILMVALWSAANVTCHCQKVCIWAVKEKDVGIALQSLCDLHNDALTIWP